MFYHLVVYLMYLGMALSSLWLLMLVEECHLLPGKQYLDTYTGNVRTDDNELKWIDINS